MDDLLNHLEDVRIEDSDHRAEMRPSQERVRDMRRVTAGDAPHAKTAGERYDLFAEVVRRGLAHLGRPEGETTTASRVVQPTGTKLVAWELLIDREDKPQPGPEQFRF